MIVVFPPTDDPLHDLVHMERLRAAMLSAIGVHLGSAIEGVSTGASQLLGEIAPLRQKRLASGVGMPLVREAKC